MPCFVPYTVEVQLLYQAFVAHLVKSFRKVHDQDIRLKPGLPGALQSSTLASVLQGEYFQFVEKKVPEITKLSRVFLLNGTAKLLLYLTKVMRYFKQNERINWKNVRPRQDSNLESSDPKSDALSSLSIRPRQYMGNFDRSIQRCTWLLASILATIFFMALPIKPYPFAACLAT